MNYTSEDLRKDRDPWWRKVMGQLRRTAVDLTDGARWKVRGYQLLKETFRAEVFSGVGFAARPRAKAAAEAVVAFIGGAEHPTIVATRDEKLRQEMARDLKPDETATFNSQCGVFCRADGTIEARTKAGTPKRLATVEDIEKLRDVFKAWVVAPTDGGLALKSLLMSFFATGVVPGGTEPPPAPAPGAPNLWPVGTTTLRGE